tara:strand:- start:730 stop:2979 length:2250 start_codon:yes stop_codon:yes gene_type:complete
MSDDIYDENAIAPSVYNTWGEGNADLGSLFEAARREEILRVLGSTDAGGPFGAAIGARGPDPTLEGFLTNIDASDGISDVEKNYFDLLNNKGYASLEDINQFLGIESTATGNTSFETFGEAENKNSQTDTVDPPSPTMNEAVTTIFANNTNSNARTYPQPDPAITGPFQESVSDIFDSDRSNVDMVDMVFDRYGEEGRDAATAAILSEYNTDELDAETIATNYNDFPLDVLMQILNRMPDNQDAIDILARSTAPTVEEPAQPPATGEGMPGEGTPGEGTPGSGTPGEGAPGSGTPGGGTPGTGAPGSGTPGTGTPGGSDQPIPEIPGVIPEIPGIITDDPEPPEIDIPTVELPNESPGGGMGFFDSAFKTEIEKELEADQALRERAQSLLGTGNVNDNLISRLNTGYTPYDDDRYTSQNADQLGANALIRNNILETPGREIFDDSLDYSKGLGSIGNTAVTGQNVNTQATDLQKDGRKSIQDIIAGQFSGTALDKYLNPYNQQVVDTSLADIERARQTQMLDNNSRATMAGAYGGDRAALVNAETNRGALDASARVAADLRARGFDEAASLYGQDADRTLKADQLNQTADAAVVRDAMNIAADIETNNQQQKRLIDSQNEQNSISGANNLLDAFGQGNDVYRSYLGDYANLGDNLDARDQRDNDFDFAQFLAANAYDQDAIDSILKMLQVSPQNRKEITSADLNASGDFEGLIGLPGDISDAVGTFKDGYDAFKDIFDKYDPTTDIKNF